MRNIIVLTAVLLSVAAQASNIKIHVDQIGFRTDGSKVAVVAGSAALPANPDIQIADDKEAAAIDPLAPGLDMTPLLNLMVDNEDVLKIFHAGGQDVEIIFNLTGKTPHPIFDTQIAMMAISQSEQIGYSNTNHVPPASALALARLIPGAQIQTPPLGHIGMVVSAGAESAVWRPLAAWLRRDGG